MGDDGRFERDDGSARARAASISGEKSIRSAALIDNTPFGRDRLGR